MRFNNFIFLNYMGSELVARMVGVESDTHSPSIPTGLFLRLREKIWIFPHFQNKASQRQQQRKFFKEGEYRVIDALSE